MCGSCYKKNSCSIKRSNCCQPVCKPYCPPICPPVASGGLLVSLSTATIAGGPTTVPLAATGIGSGALAGSVPGLGATSIVIPAGSYGVDAGISGTISAAGTIKADILLNGVIVATQSVMPAAGSATIIIPPTTFMAPVGGNVSLQITTSNGMTPPTFTLSAGNLNLVKTA